MLLTRCPSCQTTFRITAEALGKAGGQVRCGRCATVFNAHADLREQPDPETPSAPRTEPPPAPAPDAAAASRDEERTAQSAADSAHAAPPGATEPSGATVAPDARPPDAGAAPAAANAAPPVAAAARSAQSAADTPFGDLSVAELVAQVERGGDAESGRDDAEIEGGEPDAEKPMSALEIDAVLEDGPGGAVTSPTDFFAPEPRRSRWWHVAAAAAAVALVAQIVHHYRNDLATNSIVGPLLEDAYAALGAPLAPRWDLAQYQILDWVATAEPSTTGQGSLRISARVMNRGPRAQPYPHIHLQLEDRWQETVGSRVFRPSEYLETRPRRDALMEPGATARAELEVLDPGPDAYGFELDVCIEIDSVLRCAADQIFK